jgi:hypothetical protein
VSRANAAVAQAPSSAPKYELRVRRNGTFDQAFEVWQLPAPATPHVRSPVRVAGLHGRNLALVESRVLKRLAQAGIRVDVAASFSEQRFDLPEELALTLGLLFRALAPMRSRENMRQVAEGIEAMTQEEAAYWLGMAMHRPNPRRVLTALRYLLTEPSRRPAVVG